MEEDFGKKLKRFHAARAAGQWRDCYLVQHKTPLGGQPDTKGRKKSMDSKMVRRIAVLSIIFVRAKNRPDFSGRFRCLA